VLYIALALLVLAAVAAQVWIARVGAGGSPGNSLQVVLRVVNMTLLAAALLLVAYVLLRR
jgi:hypothetical protein